MTSLLRRARSGRGATPTGRQIASWPVAQVTVKGSPRSGPMPHDGYRPFAPSAALAAFPGFRFTPWRDGLGRACTAMKPA